MTCGRFKELMMASLDGEISAEDRAELESHLAECADCRREFDELSKLSELVGEIELPRPSQEDMMKYWPSVYAKIERGAGWGLLVIGAVVWVAYGVYLFITDPSTGSMTKFLIALPVVGVLMLLISVIRERINVSKTERYKEVER
ncbi:MAG: zf-HC2 domain-containing protein [Candidatus Eisenbacteria bacterium]|nr:zf-HC2 domain-containing protein [Candidatus Eisenbacteria bacterium]